MTVNQFAVLEEQQGGDAADAELGGGIATLVYIALADEHTTLIVVG